MQFNVTVDCTPAEARAFFGLPDLSPLHDVYISKMKTVAAEGLSPDDWERIFRLWATGVNQGFEQWQKLFWQTVGSAGGMGGAAGPPATR